MDVADAYVTLTYGKEGRRNGNKRTPNFIEADLERVVHRKFRLSFLLKDMPRIFSLGERVRY